MLPCLFCRPPHLQATPTPQEFVQYLIDLDPTSQHGRRFDSHFRPQWFTAYFCEADYDYIGRLETLQEDIENIRKSLNISEVNFPKLNIKLMSKLKIFRGQPNFPCTQALTTFPVVK